jgi:superfamily II DNA or RNA helicase
MVEMQPFTIPDLIDNSTPEHTLSTVFNRLLAARPTVRIATGFFNLGGYALLRESLEKATEVRLLLGKEPSPSGGDLDTTVNLEEVTGEIDADMQEVMATGRQSDHELVRSFSAFLKRENVEVHLYPKRFFHAKAYILEGIPPFGTLAIVGSSNLTAAGLTSNTKLNTVQKQAAIANEFVGWFNRFWAEAQDYKPTLIELYERAVRLYPPYLIYIKSLYETFADKLGSDLAPTEDRPSPISLADFQHDGYIAAKDILETYGGVLIADPVGYGKTYLALRLLDDYAYHLRQKVLVVCPAQLRDIWWRPKLDVYRIYAHVESQERVSQSDFPVGDYADCDLVIVDESHNFRNPAANRYENLARLLSTHKRKKLVLMTATPINTSVFDLYQQVRLITGDRDDYFAGVGISNLRSYFVQAYRNREALHDLLETIAVRRSREFIRQNYPDAKIDGRKINFPERKLHTVRYSLEKSYRWLYTEVAQLIEGLHLAPYHLDFYRKGMVRAQRAAPLHWERLRGILQGIGLTPDQAQKLAMTLGRQASLVHILKTLYLKRLESSVEALKISLGRQMRFQQKFLEQLREGRLLDATSFRRMEGIVRRIAGEDADLETRDHTRYLIATFSFPRKLLFQSTCDLSLWEEAEEEIQTLIAELPEIDPISYDLEAIEAAVALDIEALRSIRQKLEALTAREDDKLAALKKLLTGELRDKKVVVFTYFKDTARYLYRELRTDEAFLEALGHTRLSITDSGIKPQERKDRIIRFAPKAYDHPEMRDTEREIDLLISTDVLSEGQNLQDADTVVNYDLHWNPVRMVQRIGRVDRLGSDYDVVHAYNFIPEDALESLLGLVRRLRERLEDINRSGLLDAPVLGEMPTPQDFNALRRIADEDQTIWSELESLSELDVGEFLKQELLDFLKRMGEEKLKDIPLGVGTGKRAPDGRRGLFVHLRGGNQHFWLFYDLAKGKFLERKLEVMRLVRCGEGEPAVPPDFDIYPIIERAKRHIVARLRQARLKLPCLRPPQNHILNWLRTQRQDESVQELQAYFAEPLPAPYLRRLRTIWRDNRDNSAMLLRALQTFAHDNPISRPERPEVPELSEESLELVCYMALV